MNARPEERLDLFSSSGSRRRLTGGPKMRKLHMATIILLIGGAVEAQEPPRSDYAITGIQAFLYYPETGETDPRNVTVAEKQSPKVTPWNTIIREGEAKHPSAITIVQVEVAGPSFLARTKGEVSLVAEEAAEKGVKTLLRKSLPLSTLVSEKGHRVVVPFVLYDT